MAIGCGLAVLFWVRYAARCMIWASIYIFIGLLFSLGVLFMSLNGGAAAGIIGCMFWIKAAIVGVVVYCFKNTINFLCGILSAASEFIKWNIQLVIFPIIAGKISLIVNLIWVFVFVKTFFVGDVAPSILYGKEHRATVLSPGYSFTLHMFNIFAYLWIGLFILHLS